MGVDTLVCSCGIRLKVPGAVPGRLGKCPRCGSFLKVPDAPRTIPPSAPDDPTLESPTFIRQKERGRKASSSSRADHDGLVRPPQIAETRLFDSLLYPLWNASGLSVLAFGPAGLWFATVPMFALVPTARSGSPFGFLGFILLFPAFLLMYFVGGNTLRFLGQVLVTSSLGEVVQPRAPSWSLSEIGQGLWPWSWALLIGVGIGGFPVLAYWIRCGEVDWLDWIVLVDLIIPGLAYAQMALLASLMFESPLAANPLTVVRAICRVGWPYAAPCVLTGSTLVVLAGLLAAVLRIEDELGQAIAYWAFWFVLIYSSMVLLRRLGLFCFRHSVVLDWFPGRTRAAR